MKKVLIICVVMCVVFIGCGGLNNQDSSASASTEEIVNETDDSSYYEIEWAEGEVYKIAKGQEYVENSDGTYTYFGKTFKYRISLSNNRTEPGEEFSWIILTDDNSITYEDMTEQMLTDGFYGWVGIGWSKSGYTVNEDGTYTYAGNTYKKKIVVKGSSVDSPSIVSSYSILTNSDDITYDDVDKRLDDKTFVAIEHLTFAQ